MKEIINPELKDWGQLCKRPVADDSDIEPIVMQIIESVASGGDTQLLDYAKQFSKCDLTSLKVSEEEISEAVNATPIDLQKAIKQAAKNIERFHKPQLQKAKKITTTSGVVCWRKSVGIESVGLYIPGGTAPLFSTVLMLGIPAKIATCKNIFICTPPNSEGKINSAILFTANLLGIKNIYKVGGAQAIAAMAIGTESIPNANKIFGPGNQYVTCAKRLVNAMGVAIDMPAGPSEVLVLADDNANAEFIAADLLSQAEHGIDSQVILVSTSIVLLAKVSKCVEEQMQSLSRKEIVQESLKHARFIYFDELNEAIKFVNYYAPEHLIINYTNAERISNKINNAGSIFLGNYTPESAGDYASGTNHTLPTAGFAKAYSGVSVDSFVKKITVQKITKKGLRSLAPTIELMAEYELLDAHKNAVSIRLKNKYDV